MSEFPRVRLSGDVEGDYVVLAERAGGVLRVAPEQLDGAPEVTALEKTSTACPSQWEGVLEDGRAIYARYRGGVLSVGVGEDVEGAVDNGMSEQALYSEHVGDWLDGFMDFEELKRHLYGLLEFSDGLVVENEREPSFDPEALERLLGHGEGGEPTQGDD